MTTPGLLALGPLLLIVALWAGVGALVPARALEGLSVPLVLSTRLGIGAAATSVVLLAAGRAGAFRREWILGATVVFALVGAAVLARDLRGVRLPRLDRLERVLAGLVALALVVDVAASCAAPTSADALRYHLAAPSQWLDGGRIVDYFWSWTTFTPFGVDMLFAQGLAAGGPVVASAVGGALAVAAVAAVAALAAEAAGGRRDVALAAAALFALQGLVTWEATSVFAELGATAYTALALTHALRYLRTRSASAAVLAGAFAGAAAGTRYNALVVAALVVGLVAVASLRRPVHALAALGAAALLGGGWYLKNLIVTGNPVYPLFFGGKWATSELTAELHALGKAYGVSTSLVRLPLLPLDLLVHGGAFDGGGYVGPALVPLAIAAVVLRRDRAAVLLASFAFVLIVAWWTTSQQARFLLPALALLAALAAQPSVAALRAPGALRIAAAGGAVLVVLAWLLPTAALTRRVLPAAVGATTQRGLAQRLTGTYAALHEVARTVNGTVAFAGYDLTLYYPRRYVQLGTPEFAPDVPRAELRRRLRREGARYLVVQRPGGIPELAAFEPCLRRVRELPARYVTSRTRGTSTPIRLEVDEVGPPCRG